MPVRHRAHHYTYTYFACLSANAYPYGNATLHGSQSVPVTNPKLPARCLRPDSGSCSTLQGDAYFYPFAGYNPSPTIPNRNNPLRPLRLCGEYITSFASLRLCVPSHPPQTNRPSSVVHWPSRPNSVTILRIVPGAIDRMRRRVRCSLTSVI